MEKDIHSSVLGSRKSARNDEGDKSKSIEEDRRTDLGLDQLDKSRFIVVHVISLEGYFPSKTTRVGSEVIFNEGLFDWAEICV